MKRYSLALNSIRNELAVFSLSAMFLLYISAVGIYFFEKDVQPEKFGSILDSMWWALVTLTTVGYGDTYPITPLGKVFTSLIVVIGIAIIAIPTGLISSALTNTNNKNSNEALSMEFIIVVILIVFGVIYLSKPNVKFGGKASKNTESQMKGKSQSVLWMSLKAITTSIKCPARLFLKKAKIVITLSNLPYLKLDLCAIINLDGAELEL